MRDIDLLLVINYLFVAVAGFFFVKLASYMETEGGEMADGFGGILLVSVGLWHIVILLIAYSHKQKAREDYNYDEIRPAGRLFIWTFLPWSIVFILWTLT